MREEEGEIRGGEKYSDKRGMGEEWVDGINSFGELEKGEARKGEMGEYQRFKIQ